MELKLETKLSVGLAKSDLNPKVSAFGTGANLAVEVRLKVDLQSFTKTKEKWQKILSSLHTDLDHVHLNLDHSELNLKNWGESKLHDWLVKKLSVHSELKALTLHTYENYRLKWESSGC